MTTKQALESALQSADQVRSLLAVSGFTPGAQFSEQDLALANAEFNRIKAAYEAHCKEIGELA